MPQQPAPPVGMYSGGGGGGGSGGASSTGVTSGAGAPPTQGGQPEAYQVYVGDLDPNVTNHNLLQFFK